MASTPKLVADVLYSSSVFLQYRSGIPNTLDGGITALDFIVNRWLDDRSKSLSASLMLSVTRGLELIYSPDFCKQSLWKFFIQTAAVSSKKRWQDPSSRR